MERTLGKMNEQENLAKKHRKRSRKANPENGDENFKQNMDTVWRRGPNSFLPKQDSSDSDREWIMLLDRRRLRNERKKLVMTQVNANQSNTKLETIDHR
jgi:hypothetical protein